MLFISVLHKFIISFLLLFNHLNNALAFLMTRPNLGLIRPPSAADCLSKSMAPLDGGLIGSVVVRSTPNQLSTKQFTCYYISTIK